MAGAATVGRLVVTVSGDVEQLAIDMREAQAITGAATKEIVNGLNGITEATSVRNDAGKRMLSAMQREIDTFGMSIEQIKLYDATLLGVGDQAAALVERMGQMRAAQAGFTSQLAASEAEATARIHEMVAASMQEATAMNTATGATQNLTTAQAALVGVSKNYADAQRLQAQNMAGVAAAMRSTTEGTAALSAQTQIILNKYDPLGTKLRSLQADLAILRKEMGNSVDPAAIKAFQGLEDEILKTQVLMAKAGAEGFGAMEDGAKKSGFATAGATRELIVLGHEVISGNFSRLPGSFMVLAERMSFTSALFNPMTLGFVALGGAAVAVGVAIMQGHDQMVAMNNAMLVTSNYAGMSRQNMEQLAESMTRTHEVTIGAANGIVLALVNSGRIGSESIGQISRFISDFAKSTGESVDKIAPKMISLFEDPIKGAQELNASMHFLTTTQIEHIAALERTGQVQAAQNELAKAASDHMPKQAENLGIVTKAVLEQRDAWTKLWQAMMDWGKAEDKGAGAQAQKIRDEISELLAKGFTRQSPEVKQWQSALDALEPALKTQKELTQAQKDAAAANELQAKSWDAVKSSSTAYHIQELQDRLKLINEHKSEAGPDFAAQEIAKRDAIRKTNDEIEAAQRSIGAEGRQLTEQQIASEEALREVKLKATGDDITTLYKLGAISKDEFDRRSLNNTLEENLSKQTYERMLLRVAGLTSAERQAHEQKLALLKAEYDAAENKGVNAQRVDDKKIYDDLMKAISAAGDSEIKSLDSAIAKQREHNAEIGKSKEQIELAKQAQDQAAVADLQREDDAIKALLNQKDLQGILVGNDRNLYAARLAYLDAEIARLHTLADLKGEGADSEAGVKAAQELDKFLDPTKAHAFGDSLKNAFGGAGDSLSKLVTQLQSFGAKQAEIDKQRGNAAMAFLTGKKNEQEYLAAVDELNRQSAKNQVAGYADMADAAQGFFDKGSNGYRAMHAASEVLHAAEVALSVVKGVNAVLTQGEGDPYSAFARMAAMTALVAGLGVALSGGGGGGQSAADAQKAQGTGTVLGDWTGKSDSIAHSVALAAANSSTQINYLSGMLDALRNIETGIGSFAAQVVKTTGITGNTMPDTQSFSGKGVALAGAVDWGLGGAAIGSMLLPGIGTIIGGVLGALAGHTFVGKILSSVFGGSQSVTDSGFTMGRSSLGSLEANGASANQYTDVTTAGGWFSSDKHNTNTASLGADANAQFTTVLKSLAFGVTEAGKLLGVSGDAFDKHLQSFVVDIGKISLKGLTGDQIQKELEAVFSKLGDDMAQFAIGGLSQFEKVGEGYLETLTRVATDYAKMDASLASIGMTFGATGVASIKAREGLVDLMGGIDKLQSSAAGFATNFLSKAEQLAPVAKFVSDQMTALGLAGVTTRDQFKQVVLGLDLSTAAGQKEYGALMSLQDAFAATHAATVDLSKTEQEIADERKGLQDQLDQLTMTQTQLLEKQRNALDAANRPLFDMVQAAQGLAATTTNMTKFRDAAQSLHDGLLIGSLSTLTPEQQYAELRSQYDKTKAAAMGGDTTAQGNVASALTALLTESQKLNGGDSQYQADFAMGQQDSASMASWAQGQVNSTQAQLAAMNTANSTLQIIANNTTPINPANYGNQDSISVLIASNKALVASNADLKAEVAGLRADQQKQTGGMIAANAQIQQQSTQAIVGGLAAIHAASISKQAAFE